MEEESFSLKIEGVGEVSAVFTTPGDEPEAGVVVAHGQANDLDHDLIVVFCEGLARRGYASLRFNFPYSEAGRESPDSRETLMKAYRAAVEELGRRVEGKIFMGGKSLGARIASLVAEEDGAPGLIFLGYPIHRPGGEALRYEHLVEIEAPILFFAGTRDPFCNIDNLTEILEQRFHSSTLQPVEDGNHSFEPPEEDERPVGLIYEEIARVAADWLDEVL